MPDTVNMVCGFVPPLSSVRETSYGSGELLMQTVVAVRSAEDKRLGAGPGSNIAPQVQGTSRRSRYKESRHQRMGREL